MEQTTQQNIQNQSLPKKIEIIAWILRVIGSLVLLWALSVVLLSSLGLLPDSTGFKPVYIVIIFLMSLPYISGVLLSKRKKLGWYLTSFVFLFLVGWSCKSLFFSINVFDSIFKSLLLIFLIVFLILLFLDRKNFFKIAS